MRQPITQQPGAVQRNTSSAEHPIAAQGLQQLLLSTL